MIQLNPFSLIDSIKDFFKTPDLPESTTHQSLPKANLASSQLQCRSIYFNEPSLATYPNFNATSSEMKKYLRYYPDTPLSSTEGFVGTQPYEEGLLQVDDTHAIYYSQSGNPNGIPIVMLHGGPGYYSQPGCRSCDPRLFRIIKFDQRGAGQSIPLGELRKNSTSDLIHDMEILRNYLKVEKWFIIGASWGTTLGILYAEEYPNRVNGLLLRGTYLARPQDYAWLHQPGGVSKLFLSNWKRFADLVPPNEQADPYLAYAKRILGNTTSLSEKMEWSIRMSQWDDSLLNAQFYSHVSEKQTVPICPAPKSWAGQKIYSHYTSQKMMNLENRLVDNLYKIREIPTVIIHGEQDYVCHPQIALDLHRAWPGSKLHIVSGAGHFGIDPRLIRATIEGVQELYKLSLQKEEVNPLEALCY